MIGDSIPWKEDLIRVARTLEKRKAQVRWTERTSSLVERDVMVGAYAVRKLNEAHKVSDELNSRPVTVRQHLLRGKAPDEWSRWEICDYYDLEHGTDVDLTLGQFCNQIIHSWIWTLSATEEEPHLFEGILVSSDRQRKKMLYFLPVDVLTGVFDSVGHEDILSWEMRADENGERRISRVLARPSDWPSSWE